MATAALLRFLATLIFGLGGTTPLPRWVFRRAFEILTFERFTLWAVMMALPIVGYIAARPIDRYRRNAVFGLGVAALITFVLPMAWIAITPFSANAILNVDPVDSFLNRDGHDRYRYLTLDLGTLWPRFQPTPTPIVSMASTTRLACCRNSRIMEPRS